VKEVVIQKVVILKMTMMTMGLLHLAKSLLQLLLLLPHLHPLLHLHQIPRTLSSPSPWSPRKASIITIPNIILQETF